MLPHTPEHPVACRTAMHFASPASMIGIGIVAVAATLQAVAAASEPAQAEGDGLTVAVRTVDEPNPESPPLYVADPGGGDPFSTCTTSAVGCLDTAGGCPPRWFASTSGLVMTRTLPSGVPVSLGPGGGVALTTADASANWPGGVDLRLGGWLGPQQRHGVEAIYWGLYNIGTAAEAGGGGLNAIPALAGSITVAGTPATNFFTNASEQQIARNDLVNDVEINWLYSVGRHPELLDEDHRLSWLWLAGFRFFQLEDTLTLQSPFDSGNPLSLAVTSNNLLFGGQVGSRLDWRFAPRLRLAAVPKIMLAGNAVTNTSVMATESGTPAAFASGAPVNVRTTGSSFAYLGSVDGLIAWDVTTRWSLWIGYRVVGVGNIMQSDAIWPTTITSPDSLTAIDTGGETVIHGGFAGFEGRY